MLLKNKTDKFQNVGGVVFRPWRRGVVGDGTIYDKEVFERLDEKKEKDITKKNVNKGDDKKWL